MDLMPRSGPFLGDPTGVWLVDTAGERAVRMYKIIDTIYGGS